MEAYSLTIDIIVIALANPSNKSLSQKVVNFLDADDLKMLSQELQKSQCQNSFSQLIRTYYFLTNYLNKVDRTFYYSFYEEEQFHNIQIAQTALLANNYSNCFFQFRKQYKGCLIFIQKLFPECVQPCDFTAEIERMITDTDIPMPKLKRQNQGIYCKTSFQNYLVYLKFKNQCFNDYEQAFENINSYLLGRQQNYLQKLFMKAAKDQQLNKKIRFLRFTPYEITYQNLDSYLVENNSLHNVLVGLFALTDVWLNSIKSYLSSLEDPFHRYVQLITRYSIYRNFVISVQQNLSFIFQQYSELYSEVYGSGKPMYRFWRPAMTKWMIKFQQFHSQCNSIFYYCLTKQRTQAGIDYLQELELEHPEIYMTIKNKMSLRQYQIELNETLLMNEASNGVQDFFQSDPEQYQIITVEYMEYMIDLSINEETVHWCGHSEQILSQPFVSFEKYILAENRMYMNYLREVVDVCAHNKKSISEGQVQSMSVRILRQLYGRQLQYLSGLQFKPLTLKKLAQCYNMELAQVNGQMQCMDVMDVMGRIMYDYKTVDNTLKYFNQKSNIRYMISQQQMCFYSIAPLLSVDQVLTKSISTCQDSEMVEMQQQSDCEMQYFSKSSDVEGYQDNQNRIHQLDQQINITMHKNTSTSSSKQHTYPQYYQTYTAHQQDNNNNNYYQQHNNEDEDEDEDVDIQTNTNTNTNNNTNTIVDGNVNVNVGDNSNMSTNVSINNSSMDNSMIDNNADHSNSNSAKMKAKLYGIQTTTQKHNNNNNNNTINSNNNNNNNNSNSNNVILNNEQYKQNNKDQHLNLIANNTGSMYVNNHHSLGCT